jgi:hypothetical protein
MAPGASVANNTNRIVAANCLMYRRIIAGPSVRMQARIRQPEFGDAGRSRAVDGGNQVGLRDGN